MESDNRAGWFNRCQCPYWPDAVSVRAADIYAAWKTYAAACEGWDQSPLLWEFVQCQEKTFGWDKSEAIKAVL